MKGLKVAAFSFIVLAAAGIAVSVFFAPTISASALEVEVSEEDTTSNKKRVAAAGIRPIGEKSALELKKQTLTYNLGTPPYELKDGEKYCSYVTAEYEFYNPTEETIEETFAFPISAPSYSDYVETEEVLPNITVNGVAAEYAERYTYCSEDGDLAILGNYAEICLDYVQSDFFRPDLPVTEYRFKANIDGIGGSVSLKAAAFGNPVKTKYIAPFTYYGYFSIDVFDGEEFSIYVLGENEDISSLSWTGRRYNSLDEDYTEIGVDVECLEVTTTTFLDFALSSYDDSAGISEEDWYNAVYCELYDDGTLFAGKALLEFKEYDFIGWYTYNITVNAGETAVTSVTSAIYPAVSNSNYVPYEYDYTYYPSPAECFSSYGEVDVVVNTSLYMRPSYTADDEFETFDGGYKASFPSYYSDSLVLTFCTSETTSFDPRLMVILIICGIFGAIIIPAVIIIASVSVTKSAAKDANKRNCASQKRERYNMYCVKCGEQLLEGSKFCVKCGGKVENPYIGKNFRMLIKNKKEEAKQKLNVLAVVSFSLSVLAVVTANISLVFTFANAILAFVCGVVGLAVRNKYRSCYGLALAGLILSAVDLIIVCLP